MLEATGVAFVTVFLAELGDKSQLLALSLSARLRRSVLLAAVLTASALTIGLSVLLGDLAGQVIPTGALRVGAGLLFLVFAVLTLWAGEEDGKDEGASVEARPRHQFLAAVLALSAAELGDKTMFATFALAATTSAGGVWLGGTLGMAAAGAAAVLVGAALWRFLSPRTVKLVSAALFAGVGAVLLAEALLG